MGDPSHAGGTHVLTQESWSGQTVEADVARAQSILDGSLTAWLDQIKAAAESKWQPAGERGRTDHVESQCEYLGE